ncbi:MAG: tRNA-dihydrouridine synthase [bacterium]|nr:tRNA-dihydrouridine synthase [bacterium]
MQSFWYALNKPFFCLAPMADVTDPAFRALIAKHGKPDVMFTEFVSADGLYHLNEVAGARGAPFFRALRSAALGITLQNSAPLAPTNPLMRDLQFTEAERPIVMQVFSSKPEMIAYTAKLAEELGFDGFDINMGCPDKTIEKQGAGACLIKTPKLAQELIRVAKASTKLPVSIKTRVGFNQENLEEWLLALLDAEPAAIAIHLRTRNEMSAVPAHWELMKRAVTLRDKLGSKTLLIGNGDVKDLEDAKQKVQETGCDGVMLGRAIFGNLALFSKNGHPMSTFEKLEALVELAHNFEKLSPPKSFAILKKHIKAFVTGFDGAAELRAKLMAAENATDLAGVVATLAKL